MPKSIKKQDIPYQVKSNLATFKEIDNSERTVKAVVNTYNYFDFDSDVLRMGCAAKSIQERGAKSNANDKILHLLNHDLHQLVGKSTLEAETLVDGLQVLYTESYLPETTDGENLLIKYNEGMYNQHSIGFRYKQLDWIEEGSEDWERMLNTLINPEDAEKQGYMWNVTEIALHEWSTVAFGANKLTPFLGTKSASKSARLDTIYTKLNILLEKSQKREVKNKHIFELEVSQLKQMITEIVNDEHLTEDDLKKQSSNSLKTQFDISESIKKTKFII